MSWTIIQCKKVSETADNNCNVVKEGITRVKLARGEAKTLFYSYLDILYMKEYYMIWDDWDIDEENFILRAFDAEGKLIFSYEVRLEEHADTTAS